MKQRAAIALVLLGALAGSAVSTAAARESGDDLFFASSGRIASLGADGADRTIVLGGQRPRGGGFGFGSPQVSPDGTRLALAEAIEFAHFDESSRLLIADADGSNRVPITKAKRNLQAFDPSWAPDGQTIAFARFRFTREALLSEIVLHDLAAGSERVLVSERITRVLEFLSGPVFTPAGDEVAFTRTTLDDEFNYRPSLYLIGADGSGERLLQEGGADADYSPDGTLIAFTSVVDENGGDCGSDDCEFAPELYVMNSDGTGATRLTRDKGFELQPDFSPDGGLIAFASDRNYPSGGNPEIYTVRPDGSCLDWLTNGTAANYGPSWAPDATPAASCEPTARPPLIETKTPPKRHAGVRGLWLGREHRGALLSEMRRAKRGLDLSYDDCARFEPKSCPPPLYLRERAGCSDDSVRTLLGGYLGRPHLRRGALTAYTPSDRIADLWSAGTHVGLYPEATIPGQDSERDLRRAIAALRPVGSGLRPQLAPPRLPREVFGAAERAAAALADAGTVAGAAGLLGISEFKLRSRAQLARLLEREPSIGLAHCN